MVNRGCPAGGHAGVTPVTESPRRAAAKYPPMIDCQQCLADCPCIEMASFKTSPFENLGTIDPAFDNWSLFRGEIYTPENVGFRPGDIQAISTERALIRELEAALRGAAPERAARRAARLRRDAVEIEELARRLRDSIRV